MMSSMKPFIIVLEGADGTGKTTAVQAGQAYAHSQGMEVRSIHNGPDDADLPGSLYRHYRAQLLDAIDFRDQGISTFIDRSFLSEAIYGGVYRGNSRISSFGLIRLENLARHHGIELMAFEAPDGLRKTRIEERGEVWDEYKDPTIGELYTEYFRLHTSWITADRLSTTLNN